MSRLLRFDYKLNERLFLSVDAPMEVNWLKPKVEWTFALGLKYAPMSIRLSHGRDLLDGGEDRRAPRRHMGPAVRALRPSEGTGAHLVHRHGPDGPRAARQVVEGRRYGHGLIGGELAWDRNRWGGRFEWAPAVSLGVGNRVTSGESKYFTGVFAASLRWYALGPLGSWH